MRNFTYFLGAGVLLLAHLALGQNTVLTSSTTALPGVSGGANIGNIVAGPDNSYPQANDANYNVFVGDDAGRAITSGDYNAFTGRLAGRYNTTGNENTFTGSSAGRYNISGNFNAFTGAYAGYSNTTGRLNTFTGYGAGYSNTSGYHNTFLGYGADGTGSSATTLQRATALGYNAKVAVNDGLVLGDANIKVGIGTAYPDQRLTIRGNMNFVAYDNSLRLKNQPFLHFNEYESLALGLGAELAPGAEKTLVLGSEAATVRIPGILKNHRSNTGQFLTVDDQGNILLSQPRIQVTSVDDWSDKVFEPSYALRPLGEVEEFVKKNKHLPGVPSAEQVANQGVEVTTIIVRQMEKIEELTLYVVALEKENAVQSRINKALEEKVAGLEELRSMVIALKKKLDKSDYSN